MNLLAYTLSSLDLPVVLGFLQSGILRNKFVYESYVFVSALKFDGRGIFRFSTICKTFELFMGSYDTCIAPFHIVFIRFYQKESL